MQSSARTRHHRIISTLTVVQERGKTTRDCSHAIGITTTVGPGWARCCNLELKRSLSGSAVFGDASIYRVSSAVDEVAYHRPSVYGAQDTNARNLGELSAWNSGPITTLAPYFVHRSG